MADQCIVCLDNLDTAKPPPQLQPDADDTGGGGGAAGSTSNGSTTPSQPGDPAAAASPAPPNHDSGGEALNSNGNHDNDNIAVIQVCGHILHDICLKSWTQKANSCPICRQAFHLVQVYDKVGGTLLSTYKVEDKKQVVEFDPHAWLDENPEEEEAATPCPVCNSADHEDVLLLCDSCNTPYHTYCIGLDGVPEGAWFCMECADTVGPEIRASRPRFPSASGQGGRRNDFFPRTQASMRRFRNRIRSDEWMGAWGQFSGQVWDGTGIDLDSNDSDDVMEEFRRSRQQGEREREAFERWQQRLNIASRAGARDVFARNIQPVVGQPVTAQPPQPTTPQESREERRAWGAFERARECDVSSNGSRKRKSRSITASPVEPVPEPERRLKRPRTRRPGLHSEGGPSASAPSSHVVVERPRQAPTARSPPLNIEAPSFLSALLKEVEMSTSSDDENVRSLFVPPPPPIDPSSPATSPSASTHNSPRALSLTPPPNSTGRPISPVLSLSSCIEPVYPPANYSPTRSNNENGDSDHRPHHARPGSPELRQPRPRRRQPSQLPRSQDASPTRTPLPLEMKENISSIVRSALKPHWRTNQLTADQYANINRSVSHKIYEEVDSASAVDDDTKQGWKKMASQEVARAVAELKG